MELWVATGNAGKVNEFKMLFSSMSEIQIHSQNEISYYSPPPENGDSFLANARIKTRSLKALKKAHWVIGEDSGLEVEGLGNLPGIHSARYAGAKASDRENISKLLKMMDLRCHSRREAQFRCVMVTYSSDGEEFIVEEVLKGKIALKPIGQAGFGYDSIFIPEGQSQTLAELGLAFKNQISHRSKAIKQTMSIIKNHQTNFKKDFDR